MKQRIFAALAVAVIGLASLAGCGQTDASANPSSGSPAGSSQSGQEEAAGSLLDQIRQRGEIIIATEGTWAPWTYHDEADTLVGFDVEVAQAVAEKLGVKAAFVEGEWDGLLAGLDAGRYDMMANGVDVTPDRQEAYESTDPYAYNRTAVIVRLEDDSIHALADLEGKSTANTISSTYAQLAEEYGAQVTGVDDLNQTMELLLAGRIDATLNSEVTFYDYLRAQPDAQVKIAALTDEATQVAFPVPKGEVELAEAINEALNELREDGTLAQLSEKYFGSDITQIPA